MMKRVALAIVLLVGAISGAPAFTDAASAQQSEPIDTVITVDVKENGDAVWRVSNRYQLSSTEEQEAFDQIQQSINQNQTQVAETFADRLRTSVSQAETETGRNMSVQNVSVTTSRESFPDEYGVVTYEVTWTNFARVEGNSIFIGDAIRGFYVSEGTQLTIKAPDGYTLTNVEPEPDSQSSEPARVVWNGPVAFTTDEPSIQATTAAGGIPTQFLAGGAAILVVGVILVIGILRRAGIGPFARTKTETEEQEEQTPKTDNTELLSNEERILQLLEDHDGRMKQQTIVEETGWSDAKTSNVLSDLSEDGAIDKFQLGRENVISLPDTEVDPTDDLYDEERDG